MSKTKQSKRTNISRNQVEDQSYWQERISEYKQREGKQSRKAYCRENNVNYDRFQYWYMKLVKGKKQSRGVQAIPVSVKSSPRETTPSLCSIELANGRCLQIHDLSVLEWVLGRMS